MKKYFNTIIAGGLILSGMTISCKRLVEIPGNPSSSIVESQVFADSATAMTALAGVYSYPSNGGGSFTYNDGYLAPCTGLSSDELSTTENSSDLGEFYSYSLTPFNGYVSTLWGDPYKGVYPVNAILTEVPLSTGLSASFKTEIVAEMKVLRSVYYFNMVNLFGAVPLITSTDYKVNAKIGNTPVDTIYNQIIRDLTDAVQDLQTDYPSAGRVRPNKNVALTFLSKVYLYRKQWQQAYDAANAVISTGIYHLETDLNNVFLDGSQEAIWQLPAVSPGYYTVISEASQFVPYSTPNYPITHFLLNAFESGDQRLQNWVGSYTGGSSPVYYPYKYKVTSTYMNTVSEDYMIFRLGELYLIRAEAAAHLGHGTDALADVNTVRARAGLGASTADPSDQAAVLNAIMHERQVELFTEWGNRWFDLKRTGTATAVLSAEKTSFTAADTLYPVPNDQRQLNPVLKQNPGYN